MALLSCLHVDELIYTNQTLKGWVCKPESGLFIKQDPPSAIYNWNQLSAQDTTLWTSIYVGKLNLLVIDGFSKHRISQRKGIGWI